nr:MAG TPA: hypothetical protein [Caudoviricetes sp.]
MQKFIDTLMIVLAIISTFSAIVSAIFFLTFHI